MKKTKVTGSEAAIVSIVIPTKNSAIFLTECLTSIQNQTYPFIEVLVVDSGSTDQTLMVAKKYNARILRYKPKVADGVFDAPAKRNYGVSKSKGKYVYYLDADMELPKQIIAEAVGLCESGYDGVILCEDSIGVGVWAQAKNLERRCYWGDDSIEAPRFIRRSVWNIVGGLDTSVGGGGDDWDLFQKLLDHQYKVGRAETVIINHEGNVKLFDLCRKRFKYGRETLKYVSKRPKASLVSYFPIRRAYLSHWADFVKRPLDTLAFIIMRTCEYSAGLLGILYYLWTKS